MPSHAELARNYRNSNLLPQRMRLAEELIGRVGPTLWVYIRARVPEESVADTFQEVLIALARNLHTTRAETDREFVSWCYGIARRKCADFHRQRPRETALDIDELQRELEARDHIEHSSAGKQPDLQYALALLRSAKPPCVDLLWDHFVLDLDYPELAEEPGETNDAVRMRIRRCLELARELVAKKG
jgi:RNA polymerase sigma factor (sigma-70 family)